MTDTPVPARHDPKGLIREAYRISGITPEECRSIFLDWALGLPDDVPQQEALAALVAAYSGEAPGHPMTEVLRAGQVSLAAPKRRGGWRSRNRNA